MKTSFKYFFLSLFIVISFSFSNDERLNKEEAIDVFNRLNESVESINSLDFTLVNQERINNVLLRGKQKVVLTTNPFQCYILMIEPGGGEELVYAGERYSYQAIYEPNGFPYIQLELDPRGSTMRKNNHHTIFDLGFSSTMKMLNYHMRKSAFHLEAKELKVNGKDVYKLTIEFPDFSYIKHQIEKKEVLSELAERLVLSDYMLAELNKMEISEKLSPGKVITIPNSYAKKIELLVDKKNNLPFQVIVLDDKGIYERYDFFDLIVNREISIDRFNADKLGI